MRPQPKQRTLSFGLLLVGLFAVTNALSQPTNFLQDPLARALQRQDVFVGRTRRADVDVRTLLEVVHNAPADMPVKIAVISGLPSQARAFGTRDAYTHALHSWLKLGRGLLIIETKHGISASSSALSGTQIRDVLQQHLSELQTDPTQGLKDVVEALIQTAEATSTASSQTTTAGSQAPVFGETGMPVRRSPSPIVAGIVLAIFGIFALLVIFMAIAGQIASAVNRNRIKTAIKYRLERLHRQIVENISYADNYLDLLPASAAAQAAKEARQRAAELDAQAVQLLRTSRNPQDYGRAEALLQEALQQVQLCRQQIDIATGGTGVAMAVEGTDYRVTPANAPSKAAPLSAPELPDEIPPEERAVCFFCSRPARISDLTPITIAIDGKRRKVLACAEDVRIVQQGAIPQIRTVSVGGKAVPWYAAPNYDPYRDYYAPTVTYAPVYASSDGFFEGFLLGSLLSPPAPLPYPIFVDPVEVATPVQMVEPIFPDTTFTDSGLSDTGSVDFNSNGGIDTGSVDFGSGSDISADTGGVDFGGDTGGADFGGDSGSSDFGGGDF
ncbi:hypothetical protein [Chthonomonas calidirosea]|uniref:hypothetical protein n=1 Tax=Chthonomonas calidirosea TaxID=454171 RepID=UPI0006EC96A8|nr:hypothetical protein [Chthonomonas calidirosea]CEK16236.1 hypothetical protein CP488_01438 [Chthonomonas calidirosea]